MLFDRAEVSFLYFLDLTRCSLLLLICRVLLHQFDLLMLRTPLHSLLSTQLKSLEKLRPLGFSNAFPVDVKLANHFFFINGDLNSLRGWIPPLHAFVLFYDFTHHVSHYETHQTGVVLLLVFEDFVLDLFLLAFFPRQVLRSVSAHISVWWLQFLQEGTGKRLLQRLAPTSHHCLTTPLLEE